MKIHFYKYHGAGNDFILLDNRDGRYTSISNEQVATMCRRYFGIGADGLMLLNLAEGFDFEMLYYNSDGNRSSMCGNGGRCITAFAKHLGLVEHEAHFIAVDGPHHAVIDEHNIVTLDMIDVQQVNTFETYVELNTGSPHYVHFTDYLDELDVKKEGRLIRYSPKFKDEGINVNFVERNDDGSLFVRTYERGVEEETMSCGTGVTAAAIASCTGLSGSQRVSIHTPGGHLEVGFRNAADGSVHDVYLKGPATKVFEGTIEL